MDGLDSGLQARPSAGIVIAGDSNKLDLRSLCNHFNFKTRNTCMQQPLAFISKHCVNMKYFGIYQQ